MTSAPVPAAGDAVAPAVTVDGRTTGPRGGADADLVDHAYALWQLGHWPALAAIDEETIRQHPDRLKLALLTTAAHQQLGQPALTRRHAALAREWGCSDARLARWLLAGVHNTLGRAAATLGDAPRAVGHFRRSLDTAAPASVAQLALPGRLEAQYAQLGLPPPKEVDARPGHAERPGPQGALAQAIGSLVGAAERWQQRHDALAAYEAGLRDDVAQWRAALEATVKREVANMTRQVEAHADVRARLEGRPVLPALHGWAISADFARELLDIVAAGGHDLIVEFGSGTSTVLLALLLQRARQSGSELVPRLLTFEHQEAYHRQTRHQLEAAGVADFCDLRLAPLRPYVSANGRIYPYYDCRDALAEYAREWAGRPVKLFALVDGPPAATGRHARYPALPVLLEHFPDADFALLLDDYKRRDEQRVVEKWLVDFAERGFLATPTELDLEKKACRVQAAKPRPPAAA
jgi:hypothetical protein